MTTQEQKVWKAQYPAPPLRSKTILVLLLVCFGAGAFLALQWDDRAPDSSVPALVSEPKPPVVTLGPPPPVAPPFVTPVTVENPAPKIPTPAPTPAPKLPGIGNLRAVQNQNFPPGYNHALASNGATISGGNDSAKLIDGNFKIYDGSTGFGHTNWASKPPGAFVITLKDVVTIDCLRFLLWDKDERFYRFKLEICADAAGSAWNTVADFTGPTQQCRGWQTILIQGQPVKQIRLTGTFNSSNGGFHVVEFQASKGMVPDVQPHLDPNLEF